MCILAISGSYNCHTVHVIIYTIHNTYLLGIPIQFVVYNLPHHTMIKFHKIFVTQVVIKTNELTFLTKLILLFILTLKL